MIENDRKNPQNKQNQPWNDILLLSLHEIAKQYESFVDLQQLTVTILWSATNVWRKETRLYRRSRVCVWVVSLFIHIWLADK